MELHQLLKLSFRSEWQEYVANYLSRLRETNMLSKPNNIEKDVTLEIERNVKRADWCNGFQAWGVIIMVLIVAMLFFFMMFDSATRDHPINTIRSVHIPASESVIGVPERVVEAYVGAQATFVGYLRNTRNEFSKSTPSKYGLYRDQIDYLRDADRLGQMSFANPKVLYVLELSTGVRPSMTGSLSYLRGFPHRKYEKELRYFIYAFGSSLICLLLATCIANFLGSIWTHRASRFVEHHANTFGLPHSSVGARVSQDAA